MLLSMHVYFSYNNIHTYIMYIFNVSISMCKCSYESILLYSYIWYSHESLLLLSNFELLLSNFQPLLSNFELLLSHFQLLLSNFELLLSNFELLLSNFELLLSKHLNCYCLHIELLLSNYYCLTLNCYCLHI
jgi:hypothetical protein